MTRVHPTGKVTFLTLMTHGFKAGAYDYWDVTLFSNGPAAPSVGAALTCSGSLERRKPQEQGGKWSTNLIARAFAPCDDAEAPPMPAPKTVSQVTEPADTDDSKIPF